MNNKILRTELNKMAGKAKIKNYLKYSRFELAEKLDIEIPKPKQRAPPIKIPFRLVRIIKTGKTYPSMSQAANALGINTSKIYFLIVTGEAEFLYITYKNAKKIYN